MTLAWALGLVPILVLILVLVLILILTPVLILSLAQILTLTLTLMALFLMSRPAFLSVSFFFFRVPALPPLPRSLFLVLLCVAPWTGAICSQINYNAPTGGAPAEDRLKICAG